MQNSFTKEDKLISLNEAAEILQVHPNTLRHWDNNGTLKAVRIGKRKDRRYRFLDVYLFMYPPNV